MRRDHVASTLIRRQFDVVCLLGEFTLGINSLKRVHFHERYLYQIFCLLLSKREIICFCFRTPFFEGRQNNFVTVAPQLKVHSSKAWYKLLHLLYVFPFSVVHLTYLSLSSHKRGTGKLCRSKSDAAERGV